MACRELKDAHKLMQYTLILCMYTNHDIAIGTDEVGVELCIIKNKKKIGHIIVSMINSSLCFCEIALLGFHMFLT